MNLKEKRAAAVKSARDIVDGAKADSRELTADEQGQVEGFLTEAKGLDGKLANAAKSADLLGQLDALVPADNQKVGDDTQAKSLGEHFVKHAGERLREIKGLKGASASAPEFSIKAATTTQATTAGVYGPVLTDIDRTVIQAFRPRPVIADLLGTGTVSGNAITYFVEGAREGNFATVAEGAAKPQLHYVDPTAVTDALRKIAGFIKFTDEMLEDLDFVVSEINQRLLYDLAMVEESQILNGNGTGSNLLGLLNRSGIQSVLRGNAASGESVADVLFRATTAIETASGFPADGIVINPSDYQSLRLAKDANNQYFGGGFFTGQYGNGGILEKPPVWGLRTVVTPAVAAGTALVANFSQAATLYRKGGVRVESTNSHSDDFTNNLVTTRAEERLALAVRRPLAFAKVTLTPAA